MSSTFFVRPNIQQEVGVSWMPKGWIMHLIFNNILELLDKNIDSDLEECLEETFHSGIGGVDTLAPERFKRLTQKSTIAFWQLLQDSDFQAKEEYEGVMFVFLQLLILFYTDSRLNAARRRGKIIINDNLSWMSEWWIVETIVAFFAIRIRMTMNGARIVDAEKMIVYDLSPLVSELDTFCSLLFATKYLKHYFKANPFIITYVGIERFFVPAIDRFQQCLSRHPSTQTCLEKLMND